MINKVISMVVCVCIMSLCLLPANAAEEKVAGFVQIDSANPWMLAETESFKSEAKKRGYELKFFDSAGSQAKQIQAMRTFIAQGVDVIFLAPQVETGWDPVLKAAKKDGIPVILVGRSIDSDKSLYVTLIRGDQYREGVIAGEYAVKLTGGKATIAELQGTIGSSAANQRQKGFMDVIKDYPDMKVITSQSGDFQEGKGKEVMEAFLKAYGDEIDLVYSHNDGMSLGAILAIEEVGMKPHEDIKIISVDAIRDAFTALDEGKLTCTVECTPILGPISFDTYESYLEGKKLDKLIIVPAILFDENNYKDYIDNRAY